MKLPAGRLQWQLSLAAFVLILGLVSFSLLMIYQGVKGQLSSHLKTELISCLPVSEQLLKQRKDYLSAQGQVIANDPRFFASMVEGDRPTAQAEAERFLGIAHADLLVIFGNGGQILSSAANRPIHGLEETGLEVWKKPDGRADGLITISRTIFQFVQIPIFAPGHDRVGHLFLGYAVDSTLAQMLRELTRSEVCFVLDGNPLAATFSAGRTEELKARLYGLKNNEKINEIVLGGENWLVLGKNLADFSGTAASYFLLKSRDAVTLPLMRQIFKSFFAPVMAATFVTILGSFFLSVKIGSRLEKLVFGAHQISSGNLEFTLPPSADDEIGRLAEAFNQMRISLKNRLEELKEAHARTLREDRLSLVGRMASAIIHDFRSPMQVIQSSAELLAVSDLPAEKKRRHSNAILLQVERMGNMTQELLDFAKGETSARRSVVNIEDLAGELSFTAEELCRHTPVAFKMDLKNRFQLWADREKILRVLLNLIKNAREAMPGGGQVKVAFFLDGPEGVMQVSDNGPGIPVDLRGRLFEPFATSGKTGGTGLGLALSKKIVEEHGGSIQYESDPGNGTTFTIRLPAGEKVALETQAPSDTAKILV